MATLVRTRESLENGGQIELVLNTNVPAPFPVDLLRDIQGDHVAVDVTNDPFVDQLDVQDDCHEQNLLSQGVDGELDAALLAEVLPSLGQVQQSCLMTLNNLLASSADSDSTWQPILPPRRHSMPSRPADAPQAAEPQSALHTVLSNLRNRDAGQMSQVSSSAANTPELIAELSRRVDSMAHELAPADVRLSRALVSLLAHVDRLSVIDPRLFESGTHSQNHELGVSRSPTDIYDQLSRQVLDLQTQRLDHSSSASSQEHTPQRQVEIALLWTMIDHELENVSHLCRNRNEFAPVPYSPGPDQLPPEYSMHEEGEEPALPPEYDYAHQSYTEKKESLSTVQHTQTESLNEKRRMDLEAVTMAIDRLYLVAPQLHNQRVELRKSKVDELERAKLARPSTSRKGKGKQNDERELEKIIELVDKASSRRMNDQTVMMSSGMQERIERSKQREKAKRDAFVEQLASHSSVRRIASQDAVFQAGREKSADTLLTLPEFIREQVPSDVEEDAQSDPDALLSLSEIVKELPPTSRTPTQKTLTPKSSIASIENSKSPKLKHRRSKSSVGNRSRSLSAPPLAWLIPSLSRNRSNSSLRALASSSSDASNSGTRRLTVRYVAELHENLNHVLLFIGIDEGLHPGADLECEVQPSVGDPSIGDKFRLKCGSNMSILYSLPVPVKAGKAEVHVQLKHYEVKFPLAHARDSSAVPHSLPLSNDAAQRNSEDEPSYLLDASHIASMEPTSFICASCSSSLVQSQYSATSGSSAKLSYHDLPSEHWAELLEAWMCHQDQKLTERVAQHSKGMWPQRGQAFVGGSYILFDEASVVTRNLKTVILEKNDDWKRVQCICGSVVGRRQEHENSDGSQSTVYRFPKYSIRPVSVTSGPVRIPLSAFILEDMHEFVRAHATYRFVILDEEEERPRLLVWLFKPNMRLSYATTAQFVLPQTGSVRSSKILFKVLQAGDSSPVPSVSANSLSRGQPQQVDLDRILQKLPGFPQAERLVYPRDICERLVSLLKESNTAYPFGMRVMTGLLTGWLRKL